MMSAIAAGRMTWRTSLLVALVGQEIEHRDDFRLRGRSFQLRPMRVRDIADHQEGRVGGRIRRVVAEATNDGLYDLRIAAEKEPAGSWPEIVGILLHDGHGIAHRIGGDRDQDDLAAEA